VIAGAIACTLRADHPRALPETETGVLFERRHAAQDLAAIAEARRAPFQAFLHFGTRGMHGRAQVTQDRLGDPGRTGDVVVEARIVMRHGWLRMALASPTRATGRL
jgi:hypothetical protein